MYAVHNHNTLVDTYHALTGGVITCSQLPLAWDDLLRLRYSSTAQISPQKR